MSPRILTALCALLTVLCLGLGALCWQMARQNALVGRAFVEHSEKISQTLVEKLDRLLLTAESHKALEWVNFEVKLVGNSTAGQPVSGFAVRVINEAANVIAAAECKSNEAGVADLGSVKPGRYNMRITAPWGEMTQRSVMVTAGKPAHSEEIVCPAGPPLAGDVVFEVNWPPDLKRTPLSVLCSVEIVRERVLSGVTWVENEDESLRLDPRKIRLSLRADGVSSQCFVPFQVEHGRIADNPIITGPGVGKERIDFTLEDPLPNGVLTLVAGYKQSFSIHGLIVHTEQKTPDSKGAETSVRFIPVPPGEKQLLSAELDIKSGTKKPYRITLPRGVYAAAREALDEPDEPVAVVPSDKP